MRKWALLIAFAAWTASADSFGPVGITVLPSFGDGGIGGYNEHRFQIDNPSATPHDVVLTLVAPGYNVRAEVRVSRKFIVPARSNTEVTLAEPLFGWAPPRQLTVTVDGRARKPTVTLPAPSSSSYEGQRVLLGGSFPDTKLRAKMKERVSSPTALEFARTDIPPQQWSTNWLAYTSYAAIAITSSEWAEMPAAAQVALLRWLHAGGLLLVSGSGVWPSDANLLAHNDSLQRAQAGFGTLLVANEGIDKAPDLTFDWFLRGLERAGEITHIGEENPIGAMPLLTTEKVPVGAIFTLLVAFAVGAGPVLLFVLARRDRRLWIFWTLPLIATIAGGGIVISSLMAEGWQRVHRSASVTYLDENTGEATTLGLAGLYTTLPPDGQLRFSAETELRPYAPKDGLLDADITDGQRLLSGWVDSRVSTYFAFRKSERRRERLSLQQNGDAVSAVNGFGARIVKLWVADDRGHIYQAGPVDPGAHVTLQPSTLETAKDVELSLGGPDAVPTWPERIVNDPRAVLRPGMYAAVLQSSPFADAALERPNAHSAPGGVIGVAKWSKRDAF